MTQSEAASGAGVNLRTYQKYESGEVFPSSPTLTRLAETFGVPQSELFSEEGTSFSRPAIIGQLNILLSEMPENDLRTLLETIQASADMKAKSKLKV